MTARQYSNTPQQSIQGDAGMVAGSVVVERMNFNLGDFKGASNDTPLVPAQRKELNALVKQLADVGKQEPRHLWTSLHAELGVRSINEITLEQYHCARDFLNRRLAREREAGVCNTLIHLILKEADHRDAKPAMVNHCLVSYGTKHLKSLEREQLQQLLGYIQTLPPSIPAAAPPKKMRKTICWQSFAGRVKKWLGR